MKKKRFLKRVVATVMVLLLGVTMTVHASATSKKPDNSTLSDAQKELDELKEQLDKAEDIVDDLKDSQSDVKGKISKLNKSMITISAKITELENMLIAKNEEIVQTQEQLVVAQDTADKQYEDMKLRIRYMYENGQSSYLESFLAADNLAEFLNSAEYINQIQKYDRQKLEEYKNTVAEIEAFEIQLEEERTELETMKSDVEREKKHIASVIAQREDELATIKADLDEAQDEADLIAAEVQAQEEVIAEIIRVLLENGGSLGDAYAGSFTWPVPASKRVTSDFGPRKSPTAGASSNHKGIDIGASKGSDIVAVAPGKVIISRYSSSAGYYISIDHGGGLCTVYMHCSKLLVDVGDVVAGGELIAKVGSTGISTGPHLHFGVSLNGTYVSPWGYLTRP
ncbi:MAG: peptidoglycan DD-metalloendopeptidase family protein [Roseburia sp.]|nr:peptidoglycan DD-metalloendopeptidase family protein [Roseburia sp.]